MVEMLGPIPARPPTPPRPVEVRSESPSPPWLHTSINPNATPSKDGKAKDSPFKSILKESNSPIPVWSPNTNDFTPDSLAMLLESVSQQLASGSVTSRLDAYMQFFGALRTYDGLPAVNDIKGKLSLITDYIQRDVAQELVNASPLETNLVTQALKLSAAFVWHTDIASNLSDDFKIFLLDHAIASLEQAKAPKSVLTHYMSILSTQNFGPRVLTNARITKLLTVLKDLSNRVPGKAIISSRLSIYQRLLAQSEAHFILSSSLWVEHLVTGVLNHVKETRTRAIYLGFQVSAIAGPNQAISKTVRDMFDRPLDNGQKMVTEIRERLSRMVTQPDAGVHVPQAWSVIVLLLRSKKWNWDQWEHFKEWVLILQKCFNCSEPAIKSQAILGWNRFVFAIGPNESTSPSLLRMLGKPVISQFERKKSDKSATPTPLALGSYHNLLYYAFRPSAPREFLNTAWDEFIANPSFSIFSSQPALSDNTSRVLASMLWSAQAKLWSANRIYEAKKVEPEELPSFDPQWVRSRIPNILAVYESLFRASVWDDDEIHKSGIALSWVSLSKALCIASSKEITPSTETMQVVASLLGLLCRLWIIGPLSLNAPSEGAIPFTERLLLKTSPGTFQTSNTPIHRNSTSGTDLNSPILHLLEAVRTTSLISAPTLSYTQLVEGIIGASSKGRSSRGSRLELLQQFSNLGKSQTTVSVHGTLDAVLWKASARAAADALQSIPIESARERDGSVSSDYDNVTKILQAGLGFPDVHQDWSHLLGSFGRVVRTEKGDQALPGLMIEPLSKELSTLDVQETYMPLASLLSHSLSISSWPETGSTHAASSSEQHSSPSIPVNLLDAVGRTLHSSYDHFSVSETLGLAGFIESLTSFLGSGSLPFRITVLEILQTSLRPWVQDEKRKFDVQLGVDSRILTACRAITSAVLNILQTGCSDIPSAKRFETAICAGLDSPHASRCSKFVDFWQSTALDVDECGQDSALWRSLQAAKSRLVADQTAIITSSIDQQYLHINSSPPVVESSESKEPTLPVQPPLSEESIEQEDSKFQNVHNRQEVFKLIDDIRSSSPGNTPGGLGFNTPVHLRRFQGLSMHDAPLTPTLAAAENEDGFIGSSPTPATRDPTPASHVGASALGSRDVIMNDASDIPSSPPEIHSNTPSPRKKSRRSKAARKKEKKALARRAALENGTSSNPIAISDSFDRPQAETQDASDSSMSYQVDERPPSRRTRLALSQSIDNVQNTDHSEAAGTPIKPTEALPASSSKSKSRSASRNKKRKAKRQTDENHYPGSLPVTPTHASELVESSSDDLEEQIASQLVQDLELAVDQTSHGQSPDMTSHEPTQPQPSKKASSGKKRKRDEDSQSSSHNSTRRSKRLSTVNDVDAILVDDPEATQSQEPDVAMASQAEPVPRPPPSATRRSTRGSQRKEEAAAAEEPIPIISSTDKTAPEPLPPPENSVTNDKSKDQELSQRPTKRSRKSLRGPEQSFPVSTADRPTTASTTHTTRNRKSRSTRPPPSQQVPSQEESIQVEPPTELPAVDAESISALMVEERVPESFLTSEAMPDTTMDPLISTEEATNCQVTGVDLATDTVSAPSEVPMEMDVEHVLETTTQSHPLEQPVDELAAGTQSEPSPSREEMSSEAGITSSLKHLLENMKSANLSPAGLREIDDLLFNIRVEAHDASRRYNSA
ncbi:hypothetical protein N7468_006538 [Penicillium chermesinum]|uniref:Telomere-associated protein Rif1 N-terminal domain-containing protein n=1 Tax=Penicillium chermesinum TaxID=63820 RepID=A0A9W9NSU8_9EURO|nr:uncharacterized protein N7468_006538 [Penicillium chermesinum]KAJ5225313.1 hypothetical protein N7468_006538 [Penicillium chermesinum]